MPKKSLILNGFGGGVNLVSDRADLLAEGRDKDEVSESERFLLDQPGKVTTVTPTSMPNAQNIMSSYTFDQFTSGTVADQIGEPNIDDNTLAYVDKTVYKRQGVFNLGEYVNYSNNGEFIVNPPTDGTITDESSITANSDGISFSMTSKRADDYLYFIGKNASTNTTGNGLFFGGNEINASGGSSVIDFSNYIGFHQDADHDGKIGEGSGGYFLDHAEHEINDAAVSTSANDPDWKAYDSSGNRQDLNAVMTEAELNAIDYFGYHRYSGSDEDNAALVFIGGLVQVGSSTYTEGRFPPGANNVLMSNQGVALELNLTTTESLFPSLFPSI